MTIGTWLTGVESQLLGFFSSEEKAIIEFFGPLMAQVKEAALELGKQDLQVGLQIIKDAALQSVVAAATAPAGTQVQVAEATFLKVGAVEGITAVHNAEAGAIKAAVAIVQTQAAAAAAANTISTASSTTISAVADTVGDTIQKSLGG